jgi:hypothetical protein
MQFNASSLLLNPQAVILTNPCPCTLPSPPHPPTRYCDRRLVPAVTIRGEVRMRWDNGGGARLAELHGLLVRRLMIRRLKKDVLSQLPPKRRQVRARAAGCAQEAWG